MATISLIAAVSINGIIGRKGEIPWKLSDDLKRFRKLTTGHAVIMGRRTCDSIIAATGKLLPNRTNIVLTRVPHRIPPGCPRATSWDEAVAEAERVHEKDAEIFVIGGAEIYKLAMPHARRFYLTRVHFLCDGDTMFPDYEPLSWSEVIAPEEHVQDEKNQHPFTFHVLERWMGRVGRPGRQTHSAEKPAVDLANARLPEQRNAMERILARGHCPFCPENLALEHKAPILHEGTHWVLTKNQWPYPNTKAHLLLILKEHTETFSALPPEARSEFFELLSWATEEFSVKGGGVCMRFGDTELSGATVQHLHAQLIVPDRESSTYEPTRFYIGSKK